MKHRFVNTLNYNFQLNSFGNSPDLKKCVRSKKAIAKLNMPI